MCSGSRVVYLATTKPEAAQSLQRDRLKEVWHTNLFAGQASLCGGHATRWYHAFGRLRGNDGSRAASNESGYGAIKGDCPEQGRFRMPGPVSALPVTKAPTRFSQTRPKESDHACTEIQMQ
jgi:hypothetical protein